MGRPLDLFLWSEGVTLLQHLSTEEEMQEQAEGLPINLASFYDLNITAIRTVLPPSKENIDCWIVFAQEGIFRLYLQEKAEHILILLKVWEHLQERGFSRLAVLQRAYSGDIAVSLGDKLAYLTEELKGRPGELVVQSDAVEIGRCLGELHVLSQDLLPSIQGAFEQCRLVEPSLTVQREDLELFRTMARHRLYPTSFDLLFVKIYDETARLADESLDLLTEFPLDQLEHEPSWTSLLLGSCQGRVFKVNDEGTARLPYIEKVIWGLCVRDLVTLLDSVGEYTHWSVAAAVQVLDAYRSVRDLHQEEMGLMYGLGIFPKKIWEVSYDYYKGRRRQGEPQAAEMLRQEWEKAAGRREYWRLLLGDELGYENRH